MKEEMKIQWVPISKVKPYHRNTKKHSDEQIRKVAASIAEFGWTKPIVVDKKFIIIAGHGALEAARFLKREVVPIHIKTDLSPAQVQAYRIADNRLAEESEWADDLLKVEIADLKHANYDLALTGLNQDELDELFADVQPEATEENTEESVPEPYSIPVARPGELWTLGKHRLMCGDCVYDSELFKRLTQGASVTMVYTDPPYGIEIVQEDGKVSPNRPVGPGLLKGKVGGDKAFGTTRGKSGKGAGFGDLAQRALGKVGGIHKGMKAKPIIAANVYEPIEGDDTTEAARAAYKVVASLKPRPVMIFWGGNYYADALPPSSCWIVWDKNNGASFFADAELAWTNMKTAVRIFQHTWNGLIKASERGEKRVHPTQKPIALAEWCFEKYGQANDVVLDLFGGSGSTLMAAEKMDRVCFIAEKVPNYADVIIRRWQKQTGGDALLKAENLTWNEAKKQRRPRRT